MVVHDHRLIVSHSYARGVHLTRLFMLETFQKLDKDNLDEIFMCDDIWDDVLSKFDKFSDCLECFNLVVYSLLDLLVPLQKVQQQDCLWLSNPSFTKACHLHDSPTWVSFRLVFI